MNTTELKALAEKATPGPWVAGDDEDSDYFLVGPYGDDGIVYQSVVNLHSEANAAYIAAANPAALLELIAANEDAQGEIRALRATEQALRDRLAQVEAEHAALLKSISDAEPVGYLIRKVGEPNARGWLIPAMQAGSYQRDSLTREPVFSLNGIKKP